MKSEKTKLDLSPEGSPVPHASSDIGAGTTKASKPFSVWSTLGVAYSITSTPLAIGTYLSVAIGVGGSPVFVFAYLVSVIMSMCICVSLAEMAAIMPHSSGQIFWTARLASPARSRGLSYIVGWLTSAGYFCWMAATFLITSQLIYALVAVCDATFVAQPWHYYLTYLAAGAFAVLANIPLFRWYPYMLKGLVVYINAAALFILIALLVRTHPKQNAKFVFVDIVNLTGWKSNGVVFFLGLLPGLTAVNGFDCAAHMAEEMPQPQRQVPQVMVGSAVLSAVSGFAMLLVFMFCITDSDSLLTPIGGQPIAQLMVDSLDSTALTIIGIILFIICFAFACCAQLTTFSRVWWSFAREGGVPFSGFLSKSLITKKDVIPANAIYFGFVACAVIGLLELGAATALNAILGAGILFIFISYTIPIVCSLLDGRSNFDKPHYFSLGKIGGTTLNVISILWMVFVWIWLCFPLYIPVTGNTMNYAVVVFFIVVLISAVNWFCYSAKHFTAPEPMLAHEEPEYEA